MGNACASEKLKKDKTSKNEVETKTCKERITMITGSVRKSFKRLPRISFFAQNSKNELTVNNDTKEEVVKEQILEENENKINNKNEIGDVNEIEKTETNEEVINEQSNDENQNEKEKSIVQIHHSADVKENLISNSFEENISTIKEETEISNNDYENDNSKKNPDESIVCECKSEHKDDIKIDMIVSEKCSVENVNDEVAVQEKLIECKIIKRKNSIDLKSLSFDDDDESKLKLQEKTEVEIINNTTETAHEVEPEPLSTNENLTN